MRRTFLLFATVILLWTGTTVAQTPGVLYTWPGTGNTQDWLRSGSANSTTLTNTIAGQLTVTEMGDALDPDIKGGPHVFYDHDNFRSEASDDWGGLDLTGLDYIEIDVGHNHLIDTVNVQFFIQATPAYTYIWGGSDGLLGRGGGYNAPDWALGPGMHTVRFPINLLTPAEQAYIRTFGISVRNHASSENLVWTVTEARSIGTPLTARILASHDVGSSDGGLQGAIANFEVNAIVGNDGGQNQTGLSHNATGSGSLQWTDKGNGGVTANPSGAAISWGNGTVYEGNTFNERLLSAPQYDFLIFRVSATGTGPAPIGVQGWFQTGNYDFQVAGGSGFAYPLPVDGQYHDLVYPIANVTNRENIQQFGVNLFSHPNDAVINVDEVRFLDFTGLPGDYNGNNKVDAADYAVLQNNLNTATTLPNDVTPGMVTQEDYIIWRYFYGSEPSGSGATTGSGIVPEPAAILLLCSAIVTLAASRLRRS